jgi:hypothetical protein
MTRTQRRIPPRGGIIIGQQPAPGAQETEAPRKRFVRIAPDRVAKAIKAVRLLQQFANPHVYEVRPKDRQKIVEALSIEVEQLDFVLGNPGKSAPVVTFEDDG